MISCSSCPYKLICLLTTGENIEYYANRFSRRERRSYEDCLDFVKQVFKFNSARSINMYIEKFIKERWTTIEPIILKDIHEVVSYAANIIKGRWAEGEKALLDSASKNLYFALSPILYYTSSVIKGRWAEAEVFIERDYFYYQTYRAKYID